MAMVVLVVMAGRVRRRLGSPMAGTVDVVAMRGMPVAMVVMAALAVWRCTEGPVIVVSPVLEVMVVMVVQVQVAPWAAKAETVVPGVRVRSSVQVVMAVRLVAVVTEAAVARVATAVEVLTVVSATSMLLAVPAARAASRAPVVMVGTVVPREQPVLPVVQGFLDPLDKSEPAPPAANRVRAENKAITV